MVSTSRQPAAIPLLTLLALSGCAPGDRDGIALRSGGVEARFAVSGAQLSVGGETCTVHTGTVGRAKNLSRADLGSPRSSGTGTIERDGPQVTEWWRQADGGLEQGWTLSARPGGDGPLRLAVEVDGAEVSIAADSRSATLHIDEAQFRVHQLAAWDAGGVGLDVRFEPAPGGFGLRVDDSDALYPLTIDPIYSEAFGSLVTGIVVGDSSWEDYLGRALVFHGSAAGLADTPAATLTGDGVAVGFSDRLAGGSDVNGDGYDDLLVGALVDPEQRGTVYLYPGSPSGVPTSPALTLVGDTPDGLFGISLAFAGDVNGDGFDDVLLQSNGVDADAISTRMGAVYLFEGSPTGLAAAPTTVIAGTGDYEYFGSPANPAGDVDLDGYDDVMLSRVFDAEVELHLGYATTDPDTGDTDSGGDTDPPVGEDTGGNGGADKAATGCGCTSTTGAAPLLAFFPLLAWGSRRGRRTA